MLIRPGVEEKVSELAADFFALDSLENITIIVTVEEDSSSIEEFTATAKLFVSKWADQGIPSTVRVIYLSNETFAIIDRSNVFSVLADNKLAEYRNIVK